MAVEWRLLQLPCIHLLLIQEILILSSFTSPAPNNIITSVMLVSFKKETDRFVECKS